MLIQCEGEKGQEHRWYIKMDDTASPPPTNLETKLKYNEYEHYHRANWKPEFTQWRSGGGAAVAKSSRYIPSTNSKSVSAANRDISTSLYCTR